MGNRKKKQEQTTLIKAFDAIQGKEVTVETKVPKKTEYVPTWRCKKCQKKQGAWIESVYLRMDKLQQQIDELKANLNK